MFGNNLVLEADGTEIDDDDVLQHYAEQSAIFMMLNVDEQWQPINNQMETVRDNSQSQSLPNQSCLVNCTITNPTQMNSLLEELLSGSSTPSTSQNLKQFLPSTSSESEIVNGTPASSTTNNSTDKAQTVITMNNLTEEIKSGPSTSSSSSENVENSASSSLLQPENVNSSSSITINHSNGAEQSVFIIDAFDDTQLLTINQKLTLYDKKLLFANYKFNFKSIPSLISNELEAANSLNITLKHDFIHHVVNDLRKISLSIPMEIFRSVAKEITARYPKEFSILDKNDKILDTDSITLASSLLNHHQYLNRGTKRPLEPVHLRPKNFKKIKNLSDGVDNFFAILPEDTTNLENMRLWMREHADIKILSTDELHIETEYFEKTFPIQRQFLNDINSPPTIQQIKSEWPHLLKNKYILQHFNKLFVNVDTNQFPTEYDVLSTKIIEKSKKSNVIDGSKHFKALQLITTKFGENIESIFKKYSVSLFTYLK